MNKKTLGLGVAVMSLGILITPTADAFWGMNKGEDLAGKFTEFQQMIQSFTSWDDFREAMKAKRDKMKAERETQKEDREVMKEKISHVVTKIDNGVVIMITSNDVDVVAKIQENNEKKEDRECRNDHVTRTVVAIENGLQVTMTTDDADSLAKMYKRADKGWDKIEKGRRGCGDEIEGKGKGKRGGEMKEGGQGKEMKRGHGKRVEGERE